jgi:hypothetical protein
LWETLKLDWVICEKLIMQIWIRKGIEEFAHEIEKVNNSTMTSFKYTGTRVHRFKKSDPIFEPITYVWWVGPVLPVYERVQVNNGLGWIGGLVGWPVPMNTPTNNILLLKGTTTKKSILSSSFLTIFQIF